MIVSYLHVRGTSVAPMKTDSPLLVYSDAMLSSPVPRKLFEAIPWRNPEIIERLRSVQDDELTKRDSLNILRQSLGELSVPDALCLFVSEGLDHFFDNNEVR